MSSEEASVTRRGLLLSKKHSMVPTLSQMLVRQSEPGDLWEQYRLCLSLRWVEMAGPGQRVKSATVLEWARKVMLFPLPSTNAGYIVSMSYVLFHFCPLRTYLSLMTEWYLLETSSHTSDNVFHCIKISAVLSIQLSPSYFPLPSWQRGNLSLISLL